MRTLSWPTRAVLIAAVVIVLAWPTLFPKLFSSFDFLISVSHAAVLLCCILLFLRLWRRLAPMLSRPMRVVLLAGLGALVIWSWATSVVDQAESGSYHASGDDVLVSTAHLAVCFAFALVILSIGCRVGLPSKHYVSTMRKATVAAFVALSIQVLGTGTFMALYRPANYGGLYIDNFLPRVGAWFFGGWENRPAATYRFESSSFGQLQITFIFDRAGQQDRWEGWYLFICPRSQGWPVRFLRDSTTSPRRLPLDSIVLLYWLNAPSEYRQEATGRYIQIAAHFAIPGILLSIYPLLVLRRWIRQYRRDQRRRKGLCVACGYNLTGNLSGLCPECGSPIEPASSATCAETASATPPR